MREKHTGYTQNSITYTPSAPNSSRVSYIFKTSKVALKKSLKAELEHIRNTFMHAGTLINLWITPLLNIY